jgi:pimeloyl-ACP methyl ester carboxylesterase
VTLENLLDYLGEFVTALGLERVTLCGISMGGAMALGYALRHPENVEKLVLVGSYGLQDRAPVHTLS